MAYSEDVNVNLNVLAGTMSGVTAIMGGMSALTSSFGAMGTEAMNSFGTVDGLLVATTGLLVTFGVQAAEAFGEFEQGMKIVQTVSGQAQYSIAQLGEQANQLSVHYRTAIGDITEGLQTLGRAGLNSAETQLEVLESGLQTAKLEGRNLNGVLEEIIQNTAMLGGDLKSIDFGEQSAYLNSLMVGTSMTAPINSHDISQTLQYAGGTAAAAGANLENKDKLEDLMGTVAAFAQKGVKGSMSGTALRAFFTKPASQDTSVVDALSTLGLSPEDLWENGGESMKKVSDQVSIIKRRMEALNMSTMEQVELWGKIVGPKMGQQMMKLDASSIRELTTDIQGAQSAQDLANKTLQTYNQRVSELGQRGQEVFRDLGEKSLMFLNPIVNILNSIVSIFSNPAVNFVTFWSAAALGAHGLRTAFNMVRSVIGQILGLFKNINAGMLALTGSADSFTSGLTRTTSQTDLLNLKLKETNATMQAIQASALGINGVGWVANGGVPGQKVERGVIGSMKQDFVVGGTTKSGLQIGEQGRYYNPAEKAELQKAAMEQSQANKEAAAAYRAERDRINSEASKLDKQLQQTRQNLSTLTRARTEGTIASGSYGRVEDLTGKTVASDVGAKRVLNNALYNAQLDLEKAQKQEAAASDKIASLSPKELESVNNLIQKRNELARTIQASIDNEVIKANRRVDKNIAAGKLRADEAADSYRSTAVARARETAMVDQADTVKELNSVKSQIRGILGTDKISTIKSLDIQARITELEALKKEVDSVTGKIIDEQITAMQQRERDLIIKMEALSGEAILMTDEEIAAAYPTATAKEISKAIESFSQALQTEYIVVSEEIYAANMAALEAEAAAGNQAAAVSLRQNKELQEKGLHKIQGGGRLQTISTVPEEMTANVKAATQLHANGIAKSMSEAQQEFDKRIKASLYGNQKSFSGMGIRDKLQQSGTNSMNAYNNALMSARQRLSEFTTQLTWSKKGFEALSAGQKLSQYELVREAMAPLQQGALYTEEALVMLMEKTGLTAEQLGVLFQKSESLAIAFDELKTKSRNTGKTSTREETTTILANASKEGTKATGALGKLGSAAKTVTGYMGGPFMAAMMAFSFASSLYQQSVSAWQKEMSDAANRLSEAKDKMSTAEENIKQLFSSENNTISEADLDKIVDYQYGAIQESYNADMEKHGRKTKPKFSDMYNNEVVKVQNLTWTDEEKENDTLKTREDLEALNESTEALSLTEEENIKKLEENTVALNTASYIFAQALNKEAKAFNDPMHGYKGVVTGMEEETGMEGLLAVLLYVISPIEDIESQILKSLGVERAGEGTRSDTGFFDYNSPVLTQYQSGDNYAGSTEFSPILSADIYQLGVEGGLKQFFGNDYSALVQSVDQINHKSGFTVDYLSQLSNQGFQGMSDEDMAMAQMLWKEDPKSVQKLAKQMYWSETEHPGYSAMESWQTGKLRERNPNEKHPSSKDYYKNVDKKKYTVNDKNLQNTMNKLYKMTDGKLSYANMLAMGQMQMLSDMYSVANEQIYPALSQTMIAANQNVLATSAAGTNAGTASQNAGAAANNAAVIAGMLQEKLKQEAAGLEYENDYLADPNRPKSFWEQIGLKGPMTKEEFTSAYYDLNNSDMDKYRLHGAQTEMGFTARTLHPDWDNDQVQGYIDRSTDKFFDSNGKLKSGVYQDWNVVQNSILSPATDSIQNAVRAAYEQSSIGEYGDGSSGGGGSGGSGSGKGSDKDKDSGTKKERVDLVLCNKKEIPKLNVNLFKKPPNFTILNKNFKLRDIKINSQDKPKAIMNAIKNGIIETQKRMDPKIIQDEDAVYDPLSATDGSSTPSGTTQTTT